SAPPDDGEPPQKGELHGAGSEVEEGATAGDHGAEQGSEELGVRRVQTADVTPIHPAHSNAQVHGQLAAGKSVDGGDQRNQVDHSEFSEELAGEFIDPKTVGGDTIDGVANDSGPPVRRRL